MLKLLLVRDNQVLFEIPLSPADWPKDQLTGELEAFEADFQRFSKIFSALSHETRLRMMKRLMEEDDFTMDFANGSVFPIVLLNFSISFTFTKHFSGSSIVLSEGIISSKYSADIRKSLGKGSPNIFSANSLIILPFDDEVSSIVALVPIQMGSFIFNLSFVLRIKHPTSAPLFPL